MKIHPLLLAAAIAAGLSACDTKVSQCNKLIEVVNKHTAPLAQAISKLNEFDETPSVADDFIGIVEAAETDIKALEFKDESVAGFASDYQELMTEAKKLGTGLKEAGDDVAKRNEVVTNADKVVKMEDDIVQKVNTYCQAP
jgi:UDP-N-acetylglucosamine enolpyruvyl transferase